MRKRGLRSGRMRDRVTVLRNTADRDTLNQLGDDYQPVASYWAEVRFLVGREVERADALSAETTHLIKFRFGADVRPSDRLRHKGDDLEIESVGDPDGFRYELLVKAHRIEIDDE